MFNHWKIFGFETEFGCKSNGHKEKKFSDFLTGLLRESTLAQIKSFRPLMQPLLASVRMPDLILPRSPAAGRSL
jgi:hypothetical protein